MNKVIQFNLFGYYCLTRLCIECIYYENRKCDQQHMAPLG